ncbi:MAG: 1-aminocyclopropane-1-carboxylate deaminase/D-cysteine desulfhydrase [Actinomycetota bacterium]
MQTPFLWQRYPKLAQTLPHVVLGDRPSPVRPISGLERSGGASLWVKDDGVFGTVYGGNKVRKLEWILPDLQRRGAKSLFTWGGLATHWGLAAALYARRINVATHVSLVDQPIDGTVSAHLERLRKSATLRRHRSATRAGLAAPMEIGHVVISQRRIPYVVRPGGSSPLGVIGYVDAALEIADQVAAGALPPPTHIVLAVGSGGTAAGLLLGMRIAGLRSRVVGIVVAHQLKREASVIRRLARRALATLRRRGADVPDDIDIERGGLETTRAWLGAGYGHHTTESQDALTVAGERASIVLDPVYTAKAMAALLALDERGYFGKGPVLFLNTFDSLSNAIH